MFFLYIPSDPIVVDLNQKVQKVDSENKRLQNELESINNKYQNHNKNGIAWVIDLYSISLNYINLRNHHKKQTNIGNSPNN